MYTLKYRTNHTINSVLNLISQEVLKIVKLIQNNKKSLKKLQRKGKIKTTTTKHKAHA